MIKDYLILPFLYKVYLYNNRAMVRWLLVRTARWSEYLIDHSGSSAVNCSFYTKRMQT